MIDQLSPFYRKIVAITLLVILIVGVTGLLILPLYELIQTKSNKVMQAHTSVVRFQNILKRETIYRKRLATIEQAPLPEIIYYATSQTALNSQIQNDIRGIIGQSGGHIDHMQSVLPTLEDGFQKIGLSMSLRAETKILNKILQNIAAHMKLLYFDNISIRTVESQDTNRAPTMTIRWEIYGYGLLSDVQGEKM